MRIELSKGEVTIIFSRQEKDSALLTLKQLCDTRVIASNVGEVEEICRNLYTQILRERIAEERAKTFHTCIKCFTQVDIKKDRYHHTSFPSGDSTYQHINCPVLTLKEQSNES